MPLQRLVWHANSRLHRPLNNATEQPLLGKIRLVRSYKYSTQVPWMCQRICIIEGMVLPKNFDNPDEAFALAKAYAKYREQRVLGVNRKIQDGLKEDTEKENDTTK